MMMKNFKYTLLLTVIVLQFSCKKLIEINPPKTSLVNETIFSSDDQATATINGIYASMRSGSFASGTATGFSMYAGLSADELTNYNAMWTPFYENQLTPQYSNIQSLYSAPYKNIFTASSILLGLTASTGVTPPVKSQLEGEAYFIRAFNYFYLVNMFGEVPLQLSSDYRINQSLRRSPVSDIYQQIVTDLTTAERLLLETYPTNTRVRVNKMAAQAMLARTYLYLKDYANAEKYASLVIGKTDTYRLVGYDGIFLANSQEAIWQLEPNVGSNGSEATTLIPSSFSVIPGTVTLSSSFALTAFEPNDKRKDSWVRNYTIGSNTYYYPFKYKIRIAATATEYSTVLRLAEQYLIRAEARINMNNTISGIADLNIIRQRPLANGANANTLSALPLDLSKSNALIALEKERRIELFCEWGHRWLDLKRTERAGAVLSPVKTLWQSTDELYPIPQMEIVNNPLITQNLGY